MSIQAELEAIRTGAAFAPITNRAFLRITGSDATRWLNGMVTNNIKDLAPGQGNYNFLLNAQGRIQADCTIYREPGDPFLRPAGDEPTFVLETDKSQIEPIHQLLDKFIIMDDVELSRTFWIDGCAFDAPSGFAFLGAAAAEWLPKLISGNHEVQLTSAPAPGTMTVCMVNGTTLNLFAPPVSAIPYFELWFNDRREAKSEKEIIQSRLKAPELSPETLEALRILESHPKYGIDIRNTDTQKDLPQETAQAHALNFNKGCYLGQEIVERIHSRGQVHRTFSQFRLTGDLPAVPTILEANGKSVGELTSVALIGDDLYALGYIRREALTLPLTYPGGTAVPSQPPASL